jgi:hypothetical protein
VGIGGLVAFEGEAEDFAAGIDEHDNIAAANLLVYPNPIIGSEVQLMSDVALNNCKVTITDLTGRQVAVWNNLTINAGVQRFRPQTELTFGVYMLHISSADKQQTIKFVVE